VSQLLSKTIPSPEPIERDEEPEKQEKTLRQRPPIAAGTQPWPETSPLRPRAVYAKFREPQESSEPQTTRDHSRPINQSLPPPFWRYKKIWSQKISAA